jgi:D-glycero-D-manno-heptose 1,7-bisphosphate phosphatase
LNKRPAIFLDRDGTLNTEVDFLHRPEDVDLTPGAAGAIARLNTLNIPVIVVTNQSGIGRGIFGWAEYESVMAEIDKILKQSTAYLTDAFACPFHESAVGDYYHKNHPDRKPNPGMIFKAAEKHDIDLEQSWVIGDKEIDLEAGRRAGCRTALVLTGYGKKANTKNADLVAKNLAEAIKKILESQSHDR